MKAQTKQTAVSWLIEQIDNKDMGEIPMWIYDFCQLAIAIEKEQLNRACYDGYYEERQYDVRKYYSDTYEDLALPNYLTQSGIQSIKKRLAEIRNKLAALNENNILSHDYYRLQGMEEALRTLLITNTE